MEDEVETPHQKAVRAITENAVFRDALLRIFKNAEVEKKTGLGLDEVEEWLLDDAADFLEDMEEDSIRDFVEDTMATMVATAMPDQLKKGKDVADATKKCIDSLVEPVSALFVKAFSTLK